MRGGRSGRWPPRLPPPTSTLHLALSLDLGCTRRGVAVEHLLVAVEVAQILRDLLRRRVQGRARLLDAPLALGEGGENGVLQVLQPLAAHGGELPGEGWLGIAPLVDLVHRLLREPLGEAR